MGTRGEGSGGALGSGWEAKYTSTARHTCEPEYLSGNWRDRVSETKTTITSDRSHGVVELVWGGGASVLARSVWSTGGAGWTLNGIANFWSTLAPQRSTIEKPDGNPRSVDVTSPTCSLVGREPATASVRHSRRRPIERWFECGGCGGFFWQGHTRGPHRGGRAGSVFDVPGGLFQVGLSGSGNADDFR